MGAWIAGAFGFMSPPNVGADGESTLGESEPERLNWYFRVVSSDV